MLAEERGTTLTWALADHQGTVRTLINSAGVVQNQISYDSFGNITSQTNPIAAFRFGYTGREFDTETGQYYYRARYYDPKVGRFTSEDPMGFQAGDANLYRYVGNSPVNAIDPFGLEVIAVYNRQTQRLTVQDNFTGRKITIPNVITGNEGQYPIPRGEYEILQGPDEHPDWFRLDRVDRYPRNDRDDIEPQQYDPQTGRTDPRNAYRLHPGRYSLGCITVPKKQIMQYRDLENLIKNTKPDVYVQDRWGTQAELGLRNVKVKRYGYLYVY